MKSRIKNSNMRYMGHQLHTGFYARKIRWIMKWRHRYTLLDVVNNAARYYCGLLKGFAAMYDSVPESINVSNFFNYSDFLVYQCL